MDVYVPHKVGRLMQLIQHRENEYKSERVNRRGFEDYEIICEIIYIYTYIPFGSYFGSLRLYLWFQYLISSYALIVTSFVYEVTYVNMNVHLELLTYLFVIVLGDLHYLEYVPFWFKVDMLHCI